MAHDLYISSAQSDRRAAEHIRSALEAHGVRCYDPQRDILPGVSFADEIVRQIDQARAVLLLHSGAADSSRYVLREVELAVSRGKPVLPVLLDDAPPSATYRYFVSGPSWIPVRGNDGVDAVVKAALALLSSPQADGAIADRAAGAAGSAVSSDASVGAGRTRNWLGPLGRFFKGADGPAPAADEPDWRALASSVVDEMTATQIEDIASRKPSAVARGALLQVSPELPDLIDRIALQAGQIASLQDPGRKLEVIEEALRNLSLVSSSTASDTGPVTAAIRDIASQWTSVLVFEQQAAQAAAEAQREIDNPFIFGNPVYAQAGGLFTGRRDIALEIERNVLRAAQTPTLLLYGQRRMGKTSILNQLPSLLGPDFLPVLVDCQAPATVESAPAALRYLSRCVSAALNARLGLSSDEERGARGALPLPVSDLQNDPFSTFEEWLDETLTRLPAGARLLLCLDEFERLQEVIAAGWGTRLLDALRHWLQHKPRMALMFVGSHTFEQLGVAWTDRFLSARRMKVSFLTETDVRQLLTNPTPNFRLTYAPGALDAIVRATRGQPFLTQALASELVHHLNRQHRRTAQAADIEIAATDVLERSAEYFADLWMTRSDSERQVLVDVARTGPTPMTSAAARSLRDYDVLNDEGAFAVPLVERWVRETQLHA